jgi:hypothetical protein
MSKLTDFQEKLLNDLRSEFDKLNVKNEKQSSGKRFSIETIQNCINEEEKFKEVIAKHNLAMIETFKKVILNEFKAFKKEFGKVIDLEYNFCKYQSSKAESFEYFIDKNKKAPIVEHNSSEAIIYFVSKVKFIKYSEGRYDYFNGAKYFSLYLDFKRERVSITLESGKVVSFSKIIGVSYNTKDWLHRNDGEFYSSLDEAIQMNKTVQKQIVEIVQV